MRKAADYRRRTIYQKDIFFSLFFLNCWCTSCAFARSLTQSSNNDLSTWASGIFIIERAHLIRLSQHQGDYTHVFNSLQSGFENLGAQVARGIYIPLSISFAFNISPFSKFNFELATKKKIKSKKRDERKILH